VLFWLWDRGEEKKICNSQCFYFHICDIEIFGEIFPLNSKIGQITVENDVHPKFPKKQFIVKKNKFLFLKKKWGRTTLASPPNHCPFWRRI